MCPRATAKKEICVTERDPEPLRERCDDKLPAVPAVDTRHCGRTLRGRFPDSRDLKSSLFVTMLAVLSCRGRRSDGVVDQMESVKMLCKLTAADIESSERTPWRSPSHIGGRRVAGSHGPRLYQPRTACRAGFAAFKRVGSPLAFDSLLHTRERYVNGQNPCSAKQTGTTKT